MGLQGNPDETGYSIHWAGMLESDPSSLYRASARRVRRRFSYAAARPSSLWRASDFVKTTTGQVAATRNSWLQEDQSSLLQAPPRQAIQAEKRQVTAVNSVVIL
jgi:hypothetical protein